MANLSVYHDPDGRTLTVWFDDPRTEHTCEETGDEFPDKGETVVNNW